MNDKTPVYFETYSRQQANNRFALKGDFAGNLELLLRGDWDITEPYEKGELVRRGNQLFISPEDLPPGVDPLRPGEPIVFASDANKAPSPGWMSSRLFGYLFLAEKSFSVSAMEIKGSLDIFHDFKLAKLDTPPPSSGSTEISWNSLPPLAHTLSEGETPEFTRITFNEVFSFEEGSHYFLAIQKEPVAVPDRIPLSTGELPIPYTPFGNVGGVHLSVAGAGWAHRTGWLAYGETGFFSPIPNNTNNRGFPILKLIYGTTPEWNRVSGLQAVDDLSDPSEHTVPTTKALAEMPSGGGIPSSENPPADPEAGDLWFDTAAGVLKVFSTADDHSTYPAEPLGWVPSGEPSHAQRSLVLGRATIGGSWPQHAVVMGSGAHSNAGQSIVVGYEALMSGSSSGAIVMGYQAEASDEGVVLGYQAKATRHNTIALGYNALADEYSALALGPYTQVTGDNSVALGAYSEVEGGNSIAAGGYGAKARSYGSSAFGSYADAGGGNATALGNSSKALSGSSLAAGASAKVEENHNQGVALGINAEALDSVDPNDPSGYGVAVGSGASVHGYGSALGAGAKASGGHAIAIGAYGSTASGPSSIAMGNYARALHEDSAAIGRSAVTTKDKQMVLKYDEIDVIPTEAEAPSSLILRSPDGTPWRISVDDTGAIAATEVV